MAVAIYLRAMISIQQRFKRMKLDNELLSIALKESERENSVLKDVIEACREVASEIEKAGKWDCVEREMPGVYRAMKKFCSILNQAPRQCFLPGAAGIKDDFVCSRDFHPKWLSPANWKG